MYGIWSGTSFEAPLMLVGLFMNAAIANAFDEQDQGLGGAASAEVVQKVVESWETAKTKTRSKKSSSGETASR